MADRVPLVIVSGENQQLRSTDSLVSLSTLFTFLIGAGAGGSATGSGSGHLVVGAGAGASAAYGSGSNTVAIGTNAFSSVVAVGGSSVAIGSNAGASGTLGDNTLLIGGGAGNTTTCGADCAGIGGGALRSSTVGDQVTAVGGNAGRDSTLGDNNLGFGASALRQTLGGGSRIVGIGLSAFFDTTIGDDNIGIGASAGRSLASASAIRNTFIGALAGSHASQKTDAANTVAIGYESYSTADNQIVLGNSSHTETVLFGRQFLNNTSAPGGNPSGGVYVYAQSGEYKVRNTSGQITTLSNPAYVNIEDYGAVGDNSTVNTTAIQAAIDAAPSAGGILFIPVGTFLTGGTLTVSKPIIFIGEGAGSIIKANANSFNVFTLSGSPVGVQFRHFAIYGAATTNGTTQYGIFSSATAPSNVTVDDVRFSGPDSSTGLNNGLVCDGGSNWTVSNCYFERLIGVISGTGYGCLFGGASRFNVHNNVFIGASGQGRHAVYISAGCSFGDVHDNIVIDFNEAAFPIYATDVQTANTHCIVQGNIISGGGSNTSDSGAIEISFNSSDNLVRGNIVDGFDGDGIIVNGVGDTLCERNVIDGNIVRNCQKRGINVQGGAIQTSITSNTVSDNSQVGAGTHAGIRGDASYAGGTAVVDQLFVTGNVVYGSSHRASFQCGGSSPLCTNVFLGPDNCLGAANVTQIELNGTEIFGWHGPSDDKYLEVFETSDPAAPPSNAGRLYVKDNGAGKTQLVVRFPTGAVQVIATEP